MPASPTSGPGISGLTEQVQRSDGRNLVRGQRRVRATGKPRLSRLKDAEKRQSERGRECSGRSSKASRSRRARGRTMEWRSVLDAEVDAPEFPDLTRFPSWGHAATATAIIPMCPARSPAFILTSLRVAPHRLTRRRRLTQPAAKSQCTVSWAAQPKAVVFAHARQSPRRRRKAAIGH